uniref:Defensin-like protein 242 family n=2 Tax=Cajanus cajan TaxID=3821 RepID=A0A151SI25_CAJCA|nr:Defensin-like protein 242 family [Cajanus cajan]
MKLSSTLLIVCTVLALFSHAYGEIRFCPKEMTFDGSCPLGTSGRSCFEEFLSLLGASAMPMNCSCKDNSSQHKRICKCDIVCK